MGPMKKILFSILLLTGCASKPINLIPAPSYERLTVIKGQLELKNAVPSEQIAKTYLTALKEESAGNTKAACKLFRNLSEKRDFPLNETSLVHTLKNCSFSERELKKLWETTVVSSYLKETYFEYSLKVAKKLNIEEAIAEFSYNLAPFKQVQVEKVKLLKRAVEIAQKLGLSENEDKYYKRLTEISPLYLKEVTPENIYKVARDFESIRQFDKARDMYLDIINGAFTLEEKIKAYNSYRMSFKVARNLKMFLEKTGEMELFLRQLLDEDSSNQKLQEAWVDAKINYARAIWTEHLNQEARIILDDILERNVGNQNQLATLYWIYGSLHIESKENDEALAKFEKAAQFKVSSLDQQETIQWSLVWNKYLVKKYSNVVNDVERFVKKSTNPNFIHKLNFWKAKSFEKLKRISEAKELFSMTATADPFGYYGLISAMEVNLPLAPFKPSIVIKEPFGHLVLDWLIAMEEKSFSVKVLKEINSQFKTIPERERVMSLYAQTEWYQGGMIQIYNFPMRLRDELTQKYISIIYPAPYKDIFSKYARKYHLSASLPYSIARQESAFNPNARSWADAFGLMQLIPEKASELSKKHSIAYKDFNDLYKPEINVEMGIAFLSELHAAFKGKFAQNVAGYNASTTAIAVWEKERFHGDYLEFIEMIPYEETRNYIKLVFRNYITYERILADKEIFIPKNFFAQPFN